MSARAMSVPQTRRSERSGRAVWTEHLGVLTLIAILTLVMTWPLAAILDWGVLGPPGDNLEYVWKMWWFKQALFERHTSPFFNPDVFYPFGYPLALGEMTLANTLLLAPVTLLLGETAAYNLAMLGSFVLSGYGVYLLLRGLRCGPIAALFGGLAFSFCPYRMSHLGAGHLPLMGTGWIPLLFWSLERLVQAPSWRRGWPIGLFYAAAAHSSWYYALMIAPFAGLYLLLRARPWRRSPGEGEPGPGERRALWAGLGVAALVASALLAPALRLVLPQFRSGEMGYSQSLAYVDQWSASPIDFLYPNAMHSLWGAPLTWSYYQNINESLVYLGWVPMLLAGLGLWRAVKARSAGQRALRLYALVGALALLLALGTTLHYAGEPVYLRVSSEIEYAFSRALYVLTGKLALNKVSYGALQRESAIPLPLPTLLLYLFVPFMSAMRVWSRFGVLVMQSVAILAAWGLDGLLSRPGTQSSSELRLSRAWLGGVAILLLLLDFAVLPYPYGYTEVRGQPVDEWLARQPGREAIIHFPLDKTWYGWMLYPQVVHGRPMAYGYGTFAPEAYERAAETLSEWPSQQALDQLKAWGVGYIALGARSYGDDWPRVASETAALPGLHKAGVFTDRRRFFSDRLLQLVRPSADVPSTELIAGARRAYLRDEIHVYEIQ